MKLRIAGIHDPHPCPSPLEGEGKRERGLFQRGLGIYFAIILVIALCSPVAAADQWQGVDKTVVEKIAKEHGREVRGPLINTDQGDLLLFIFLVAGAAGGFAAGYSWRMLTERRKQAERKDGNAFP